MVHELPPLHHVVGVQLTGGVHVRHDVDTYLKLTTMPTTIDMRMTSHQSGGGEGGPCLGHLGSPHPVTVLGQQRPLEGGVG